MTNLNQASETLRHLFFHLQYSKLRSYLGLTKLQTIWTNRHWLAWKLQFTIKLLRPCHRTWFFISKVFLELSILHPALPFPLKLFHIPESPLDPVNCADSLLSSPWSICWFKSFQKILCCFVPHLLSLLLVV
jgi:hypothetical protein